jgi:S1-C subfamily serine protease
MVALAMLTIGTALGRAADIGGSGVVVGGHGEVLTNAHVVKSCAQINVRSSAGDSATAQLIAHDEKNDLAVIRSATPLSSVAAFRDGKPVRAGDAVVALGYPLSGLLATTANLTVGNVSALAGLGDDSRYLQISAPVQPGNSGGPLLDASGHVIGIVTAKLDAALVARFTGDIPQNVNFALKAEVVRTFLDSKGITYQTARSDQQLSAADVGEIARPFTVQIECRQPTVAAISPTLPATATAILYEEEPNNPQGRKYSGSVTWRAEKVARGQLSIRADIKIPQRQMSVVLKMSRNTDPELRASHVIDIVFNRDIANVPGILMKNSEQERGTPLAGLAVKYQQTSFLVGLPSADVQRNVELLKDGSWFDIPFVYRNGGRGIIAVQKGEAGNRLLAEAFLSWGQ